MARTGREQPKSGRLALKGVRVRVWGLKVQWILGVDLL
jgi:hypothetical protein